MVDYQKLSDNDLISLLYTEEDRLPREAIDEFVQRGERMVKPLAEIVSDEKSWYRIIPEGWAIYHAVYILGAIGTSSTIEALLLALRFSDESDNILIHTDLPSIFGRIGPPALKGLWKTATDETLRWNTRNTAFEGIAAITLHYPEAEQEAFSLVHSLLVNPQLTPMVRKRAGTILVEFLREEYITDLIAFAREEREHAEKDKSYLSWCYDDDDVEKMFQCGSKQIEHYTREWLSFYDPQEIESRQRMRAELFGK